VIHAKQGVAAGLEPAVALAKAGQFLNLSAGTMLSDTGRAAEKVSGASTTASASVSAGVTVVSSDMCLSSIAVDKPRTSIALAGRI
jgi:hypothetical protein